METANERLLFMALSEYGRREVPGSKSDGRILSWIRSVFPLATDDSKVPWCGLFMREIAERVCAEIPDGPALARNWLNVGERVDNPIPGDIVVFSRGSSGWQGHVGIYCNDNNKTVHVLGGNQKNAVNIAEYRRDRVLGFRRLKIVSNEDANLLG